MDVIKRLMDAGFSQVLILDGFACGADAPTLLLAMMCYEAEQYSNEDGALIHPYYFASQKAYKAAFSLAEEAKQEGVGLMLRDEIRVKPIFARIPQLSQGRNTLSYAEGVGSRFHVQIFTLDEPLTPNVELEATAHPRHCGSCTKCMQVCPTHAIDEEGFHRDRCLRNWQMSGKPVPEELRPYMGMRLIGCDECQRNCPHNPAAEKAPSVTISLQELLTRPKDACVLLKDQIGANLALPNRVLGQALLLAGCSKDPSLLPIVQGLTRHPSPVVSEHARWASAILLEEENK